jgi:Holliday junction resolvase RusA-like endonuclease
MPKARIAVKIEFFPDKNVQVPAVQNLVKTYLDLLKGIAFKDDRQIWYLSAYCYRNNKRAKNSHSKKGHVYIKVERFSDLLEKYNMYFELKDEIDYDYKSCYRHNFRRDCGDWGIIAEKLKLEPAKVAELKQYDKIEKQLKCLSVLDNSDWPGVLKNPYLHVLCGDLEKYFPFNFHISGVLSSNQKKHSEAAILNKFTAYSNKVSGGKILSPVELDVQVRTKNNRLIKDLDNIIKNIAPFLQKHVLSDESCIYGYRIYVVNNPNTNGKLEGLRIKLVPPFSISDYETMIEEVIEEGKNWLEQFVSL